MEESPRDYLNPVSAGSGCRYTFSLGFPGGASGEDSTCQCERHKIRFNPWVRKIPWRKKWQPTPVFLPGESHRQRSLVGYGPLDHKESDTTEVTEQQGDKIQIRNNSIRTS